MKASILLPTIFLMGCSSFRSPNNASTEDNCNSVISTANLFEDISRLERKIGDYSRLINQSLSANINSRFSEEWEMALLQRKTKIDEEYLGKLTELLDDMTSLSPTGLMLIHDFDQMMDLFDSANTLTIYGDQEILDMFQSSFGGHLEFPITVSSAEKISALKSLIKADYKYDEELSEDIKRKVGFGCSEWYNIEIDDLAYIYILGDMMIFSNDTGYRCRQGTESNRYYFPGEMYKTVYQ